MTNRTEVDSDTIFHQAGLVELRTAHGPLVLTEEEYRKALRRGASVARNREYVDVTAHNIQFSKPAECVHGL